MGLEKFARVIRCFMAFLLIYGRIGVWWIVSDGVTWVDEFPFVSFYADGGERGGEPLKFQVV